MSTAATTGRERLLRQRWGQRWPGMLVAAALVTGCGVLGAALLPRGAVTAAHALAGMAVLLVVGVGAGLAAGTRWSVLGAPLLFAVAFELARLDAVGPTVDAPNLGSLYGTIAFVLGRGMGVLLMLLPLALGARLGIDLAARLGHPTARRMSSLGWTGFVAGVVVLGILAFFIARPASTAAISGPDGDPLPGSVSELVTVPLGGHDQTLMVRGRDATKPVLLFLAGGPGGTELGAMRRDVTLEQDFVVVTWDQRGAGASYPALDPVSTLTLDGMIADTIELTEHLATRFGQERIFLVGQSWGSTLAVLAAQARPDLYHAVVGVGQMVSQRETDVMFWADAAAWADETQNAGLAERLRESGPPPYDDLYDYEPVVSTEHEWNAYPGMDLSHELPGTLFVPEYAFLDRVNAFRGFFDTNATLYPQLQDIDFRRDVPELEVPYVLVIGEHEARGRAVLADEWFAMLEAPVTERVVFEGSGHRPNFDEPARFAELMASLATRFDH